MIVWVDIYVGRCWLFMEVVGWGSGEGILMIYIGMHGVCMVVYVLLVAISALGRTITT